MNPTSISIIIPVYNNISRLEKCLRSLTFQTIPREAYEIIVVDNGSTDGSYEIAKRYADKVLIQNKMKSPYPSRNMGVKASTGFYKILIDSYLVVESDFLEKGINDLEAKDGDFGAPEIIFELTQESSDWEKLDSLIFHTVQKCVANGGCPGGCIFTKDVFFERYGYFHENIRSNGDTIWSNAATKAGAKLVYLNSVKTHYPPKKRKDLLLKQRRIGKGNRFVWLKLQNVSPGIVLLKAIWNMRPNSIKSIKELITEKRQNDIEYPVVKLCIMYWFAKIHLGLGRMGLYYS